MNQPIDDGNYKISDSMTTAWVSPTLFLKTSVLPIFTSMNLGRYSSIRHKAICSHFIEIKLQKNEIPSVF